MVHNGKGVAPVRFFREPAWRDIGPVIAISGLFTFAWTTSTLVDIVKKQHELIEKLVDRLAMKKRPHAADPSMRELPPTLHSD